MRVLQSGSMARIRWAFCFSDWKPTVEEWTLAGQSIQSEEKDRINRFVFKRDSKSAMAGRLLLRKAIHEEVGIPYDGIVLKRTEKGKPYLSNKLPSDQQAFNFNVSHQGDYAVLGAQRGYLVGVDIMKIDEPRGTRIDEFFDRMSRQFTKQEWGYVKLGEGTLEQLTRFYRLWCLKESYVKALGVGIGFDLQRIDFHIYTPMLAAGERTSNTQLHVDGCHDCSWRFEETRIDNDHYVAIATQKVDAVSHPESNITEKSDIPEFSQLSFSELILGAEPQTEPDLLFWHNFQSKLEKPGD